MALAHCQAPSERGLLVAVEGIDGSGKATLSAALREHLAKTQPTEVISSPGYERTEAGRLIGRYLNGDLAIADDNPYTVAMLFAIDRQETQAHIVQLLRSRVNVVVDRYVFSNAAYQAARSTQPERLRTWILNLEFERLNCPIPDLNVFVDMPVQRAKTLVARKARRSYTASDRDRYEADDKLLEDVRREYRMLTSTSGFGRWLTLHPEVDGHLKAPAMLADEVASAL